MRKIIALVISFLFMPATGAFAQTADTGTVSGIVVDASSGLPLNGANVSSVGQSVQRTTTDGSGRFSVTDLPLGVYQLRVTLAGYQTTLSDSFTVLKGSSPTVTLSITREREGNTSLREIGRTSVRAAESLQKSSVIYKDASAESIEREGFYRVGDYLRSLPQVNLSAATGGSDTPSAGDDLYIDIRGIGGLETVALVDGHPLGFGINRGKNLGYNFEVSPTFALRNVQVNYGSGNSGLIAYSSVGGVVDMQTLEPTPNFRANISQGFGTFDKYVTTANVTGPISSRLGFAVAAGSQFIDGPYKNLNIFQPGAAFDPTAPVGSPVYNLGIYKDDSAVVNRGDFLKLKYAFGNPQKLAHVTASALSAYYFDDKTGNGDQDFLPFDTALAIGNSGLAAYAPPMTAPTGPFSPSNPPACGAGTFLGTNANASAYGFGPDGMPDGGKSCLTPQQYAGYVSGFQGAGTTFQTFTINDYHLKYEQPYGATNFTADAYTNRFYQLYDRTFQLPFVQAPGDNAFYLSPSVNTTGVSFSDELPGRNNDIGIGYSYNNYAYLFKSNGNVVPSPIVDDSNIFFQDVFHPEHGHFSAYLNAAEKTSTITHTTLFDPRLAIVYNATKNDVIRVAAGAATVQPYATYIDLPYSPIALGALNGDQLHRSHDDRSGRQPQYSPRARERQRDQRRSSLPRRFADPSYGLQRERQQQDLQRSYSNRGPPRRDDRPHDPAQFRVAHQCGVRHERPHRRRRQLAGQRRSSARARLRYLGTRAREPSTVLRLRLLDGIVVAPLGARRSAAEQSHADSERATARRSAAQSSDRRRCHLRKEHRSTTDSILRLGEQRQEQRSV